MKSGRLRLFGLAFGLAAIARFLLPLAAAPRGFVARIDADGAAAVSRVDDRLRFGLDGTPALPASPVTGIWQGYLNAAEGPTLRFYGRSPGGTTEIILDSRAVTVAPAGFWSFELPVEPGWHRLLLRLSVPRGAATQFEAGRIVDGREEPFDQRTVLRAQPSRRTLMLDRAVGGAILAADLLLALVALSAVAATTMLVAPIVSGAGARLMARALRRPSRRAVLWAALVVGALASVAIAYRIATLQLIIGSIEGHQIYQYVEEFSPSSLAAAAFASLVVAALLAMPSAILDRAEWAVVSLWALTATGLQALLRSLTPFSFERIFVNDGANSFYGATLRVSAGAVLADFGRLRFELPLHAYSNMPGKLMLVYALENLSKNPATLAWLVVAVSNAGGILLYLLMRDLSADRRVALYAYVLYLFVPAKLYFFPLLNAVTPVVVCCCLFLLVRWLLSRRAVYAALLGAALYGLIFFEPLALTTGLLFVALIWWAIAARGLPWRTLLWQGSVAAAAFAVTYLLVLAAFHFSLFDAMRDVGGDAVGFNDRFDRPYGIWVRQNILDFLFGVGVCQALIFWVALASSLTDAGSWRERVSRPELIVTASLAATLAAIDLIGVNRGEIVRLWIFLACLFQIPAAYLCARLNSRAAMTLILVLTILQNALGTSMIGFIQS